MWGSSCLVWVVWPGGGQGSNMESGVLNTLYVNHSGASREVSCHSFSAYYLCQMLHGECEISF